LEEVFGLDIKDVIHDSALVPALHTARRAFALSFAYALLLEELDLHLESLKIVLVDQILLRLQPFLALNFADFNHLFRGDGAKFDLKARAGHIDLFEEHLGWRPGAHNDPGFCVLLDLLGSSEANEVFGVGEGEEAVLEGLFLGGRRLEVLLEVGGKHLVEHLGEGDLVVEALRLLEVPVWLYAARRASSVLYHQPELLCKLQLILLGLDSVEVLLHLFLRVVEDVLWVCAFAQPQLVQLEVVPALTAQLRLLHYRPEPQVDFLPAQPVLVPDCQHYLHHVRVAY